MEINEHLIRHIAELAKLELTDKEVKAFVVQLQEVFQSFKVLEQADVHGVEPSFHAVEIRNHTRKDKALPSLSQDEALQNSQHTMQGYFKAPRAV